MNDRLAALRDLARMVRDAELARLGRHGARVAAARDRLDALNAARADRAAALATQPTPDPAARAGQDPRWQILLAARTDAAAQALARARADHEACKATARRAFGRHEALAELTRRAAEAKRR